MDESGLVEGLKDPTEGHAEQGHDGRRQGAERLGPLGQGLRALHQDVCDIGSVLLVAGFVVAEAVDVGMAELGGGDRLALKPPAQGGIAGEHRLESLDGEEAIGLGLDGEPYFSEGPTVKEGLEPVASPVLATREEFGRGRGRVAGRHGRIINESGLQCKTPVLCRQERRQGLAGATLGRNTSVGCSSEADMTRPVQWGISRIKAHPGGLETEKAVTEICRRRRPRWKEAEAFGSSPGPRTIVG